MHPESLDLMTKCLYRLPRPDGALILDVGSRDINGTYRPIVETCGAIYTGLDIQAGPNVDVVIVDPYKYPFSDGYFAAVICGNMLHNSDAFWRIIPEMTRVVAVGGVIAVVAPTWSKPHSGKYPVDRWRFMPEGIQYLFDMTGCLGDYQIVEQGMDVCGSAIKR